MASPAAVLQVFVTANTGQASRSLLKFNATMKATETSSSKALGAVQTFAKGTAIGVGGALAYSVKKAADFEQQLDSLGAVTSASGRSMELFRKQALKAGADTKFSALDAAVAQTELAKGGLSVRNIMRGGLRSALALAAAGELELGDAASYTVNAMKLFGIHGKDSMQVADALATAANKTTADVSDFGIALRQGGTAARAAGLSFNETIAALETLAAIGIKGSDAGTSLRTTFAQLASPTKKAAELMDALNINFFDSQGNMKSLVDISAMLRDRLGGLTKEQRLQATATLVGQDGMRTLLALFDAGPAKVAKFAQGLSKSGTAAEVAAKKQDNLKGRLENLRGSVETLAISFGSKLLPALTDAAEQITKVLNDKNLSGGEKFDRLGQMLGHALAAAGPVVAKASAQLAVVGVRAFFNAFRESPLWIKLLTAGFILSKLGGFSAFRTIGRRGGTEMAAGMGEGVAKSGGGIAGRFKGAAGAFRTVGRTVLGGALIAGVADAATRTDISGIGDRFQQAFSTASFGLIPEPRALSDKFREAIKVATQVGDLRFPGFSRVLDDMSKGLSGKQKEIIGKLRDLRQQAAALFGPKAHLRMDVAVNVDQATKSLRMLRNEFGRMRSGAVLSLKEVREVTGSNFRRIAELMGTGSREGQQAVSKNFRLAIASVVDFRRRGVVSAARAGETIAALMKNNTGRGKDALAKNMLAAQRAIAATMSRSGKITEQGTDLIRALMVNAMKNMGLSPDTIRMSLNKRESAKKGFTQPGQTGLIVRGGKPAGDSVHALLERGEVVVNRTAVQKLGGPHEVNKLNQAIPRFQEGGPVGFRRGGRADKVKVAQPNFGDHPSNVSGGVAKLIGVMQGRFPGLAVTSTTDHSYLTTSGNVSDHASGHAVDLASGDFGYMNKAAAWVRRSGLARQISQGIHNPNLAVANGQIQTPPGQYAGHTWTEHADHIHLAVQGALKAAGLGGVGGAVPKLAKLAVSGGGAMGALVEGGLGKVRDAAQHKLNRLATRATGLGKEKGLGTSLGPPPPPGVASRGQMVRWATTALHKTGHGASPDAVEKILELARKESGWNTHSINLWDSNAAAGNPSVGLMQVTIDKMGMHWPQDQDNPRLWDPVANMIASINYQFGRYGGLTTQSPYAKGGAVGYVGDSLGMGTVPKLKGILDAAVHSNSVLGRSSASGVSALKGLLGKDNKQFVFDLGTNDGSASQTRSSLQAFDKQTGNRPLHAFTVLGPEADAKNKALRGMAHGDINLVDWARVAGQYNLDPAQHIHPDGAGYGRRAHMVADSIRKHWDDTRKTGSKTPKLAEVTKPFRGSPGRVLNKTLKALESTKSAKGRGVRLKQFEKKVKGIGLPAKLTSSLNFLSGSATVLGDRADRAGQLNVSNDDGTSTLGVFQGKDESGWLNDQLGVLFQWRNKLTDALGIIEKRRKEAAKLLERARERLKKVKRDIESVAKFQRERRKQLDELRKHPKQNKDKIADLRKIVMRVDDWMDGQVQVREGLSKSIIPALTGRGKALRDQYGTFAGTEGLEAIQGAGGPLTRLSALPPLGALGGQIFDVQLRLRDLAIPATQTTDNSPVTDETNVELLKQLLREANLRTSVSEAQFRALRDFDKSSGAPFMGAFAKGGVALVGEKGPELAHFPSGTRVHNAQDTSRMVAPNVQVHINGDIVNTPRGKDPVEVLLNDRRFKAAVSNSRLGGRAPLPGRGGGL